MSAVAVAAAAFVFGVVVDFLWGVYIALVAGRKRLKAAVVSSTMAALSMVSVLAVVADRWVIPFYVLGMGVGTWLAVGKEEE